MIDIKTMLIACSVEIWLIAVFLLLLFCDDVGFACFIQFFAIFLIPFIIAVQGCLYAEDEADDGAGIKEETELKQEIKVGNTTLTRKKTFTFTPTHLTQHTDL